jgi:hypothetical protein
MGMRIIALIGLATGLLAGAPALAEGDFAGVWAVEVDTGQAVRTGTWTVSESEDGGYAIHVVQEDATDDATDVTFDGTTFTFKRSIGGAQGALEASYGGTVEGDALSGEVEVGQVGTFPLKGVRQ